MAYPIDKNLGAYNGGVHDAFGAATGGRTFPHTGSDFHSYGASYIPVYATEGGTVIRARYNSAAGNYVIVHQPSGWWLYGHLSGFSVREGQTVREGQRLGNMGASGRAWGVHVHITRFLSLGGALANPIPPQKYKGESTGSWARRAGLGDPMDIINRKSDGGGTPPLTQDEKDLKEIMGAVDDIKKYVTRSSENTRAEIKKHTQSVVNAVETRLKKYVDDRVTGSEWRMRREVRMRLIYVKTMNGTEYDVNTSPYAAAISVSGGGIRVLNAPDRSSQIASLKANYLLIDENEQPKGMALGTFMNQLKEIAQSVEDREAIREGRVRKVLTQEDVKSAFGWV